MSAAQIYFLGGTLVVVGAATIVLQMFVVGPMQKRIEDETAEIRARTAAINLKTEELRRR